MFPMRTRRTLSIILIALTGGAILSSCAGAPGVEDKFVNVLSENQLSRLRACESGGNYNATSSTGKYRGAYQFSRTTWNSIARMHYPFLEGTDPAQAWAWDQDRMARALWATSGRGQWPHCGRNI